MANTTSTSAPYNDSIMTYDYNQHRYYLNANGVTQAIGVNLDLELNAAISGNPYAVNNFLAEVTDIVYDYIYEDNPNEEYIEYLLATYAPLRGEVQKMLLSQVKYAIINNFVDMYSGVNIPKGTAMERYKLRSVIRVAPQVERACRRNLAGLSFCLKTILELPQIPAHVFRNGY